MDKHEDIGDIERLLEIMARLRDPQSGCPWDLEQSFESIAPYTIEEAYEVAEAIERGDAAELADELGDLLLQVVFHAQIARERGDFAFADVTRHICEKMIRRHPHVFAGARIENAAAQTVAWEALKRAEKRAAARSDRALDDGAPERDAHEEPGPTHDALERGASERMTREDDAPENDAAEEGVLHGVTLGLPALTRAVKLARRASRVGFDWPDAAGPRAKISEELAELDEAIVSADRGRIEHEVGDLLFAVANLCRHLDVDPEQCARGANRRFEARFGHVERRVRESRRAWSLHSLGQLDAYWEEAKRSEGAD